MDKKTIGALLVAVAASATLSACASSTPANAAADSGHVCQNNSCKGKADCMGFGNDSCKGQNACKGHGTLSANTKAECEKKAGLWVAK